MQIEISIIWSRRARSACKGESFSASDVLMLLHLRRDIPVNLDIPLISLKIGRKRSTAAQPTTHRKAQTPRPAQRFARVLSHRLAVAFDRIIVENCLFPLRQRPLHQRLTLQLAISDTQHGMDSL